jgi:hypothetical protein
MGICQMYILNDIMKLKTIDLFYKWKQCLCNLERHHLISPWVMVSAVMRQQTCFAKKERHPTSTICESLKLKL